MRCDMPNQAFCITTHTLHHKQRQPPAHYSTPIGAGSAQLSASSTDAQGRITFFLSLHHIVLIYHCSGCVLAVTLDQPRPYLEAQQLGRCLRPGDSPGASAVGCCSGHLERLAKLSVLSGVIGLHTG